MSPVPAAKRSISFDPEVLAAAERAAAAEHGGNLSALVNEAVSRQVKLRGLGELLDEMDEKYGPVSEQGIAEAERELYGWESRSTRAR